MEAAAGASLSLRELNRATLARQGLLTREPWGVVEAVGRLGGMQAQEPKHPWVGLWTRLADFDLEAGRAALHDRSLVRGTLMRATLHLARAEDYVALRGPLAPALDAPRVLGERARGLDPDAVLGAARELLGEAPRTFTALRAELQTRFPDVDERALGFTVRMGLPLVMVPTGDRWGYPADAAFALAEAWLGVAVDQPGSPADVVRRHLAAFGPATAADVQAWSGLKALRPVLAELRGELEVLRGPDGRELLDLPEAPRPLAETPAPARLLPEFDSLVLAHKDRTRIVPEAHRGRVVTRNLRVRATFLWGGWVAGTWDVERRRSRAVLRLRAFEELPPGAFEALEAEAQSLLGFLEPDADERRVEPGERVGG